MLWFMVTLWFRFTAMYLILLLIINIHLALIGKMFQYLNNFFCPKCC